MNRIFVMAILVVGMAAGNLKADHWGRGFYSRGYGYRSSGFGYRSGYGYRSRGVTFSVAGPGGYLVVGDGPVGPYADFPYYDDFGYGPPGYGYWGSGYGYHGYGPYRYESYGYGPYGVQILPPLFVPAEAVYGNIFPWSNPQIVQPAPQINILNVDPADGLPLGELELAPPPQKRPQVRTSNAAAVERAWRFVQIGDGLFAGQKYREAYHRYRDASKAAPDLLDVYLRQGQAMLASGQYDIAAAAFKRGLRLFPDWSQTTFRLAELYGNQQVARRAHLAAVADAADRNPHDGDLLLLVGLQLLLGDQPERSTVFFRRANELLADELLHLDGLALGGQDAGGDGPAAAPAPRAAPVPRAAAGRRAF